MATRRVSASEVLDPASLTALVQDIKPQPLAVERKSAMRARLLERIQNADAPAPPGTETVRADAMEWLALTPLIDVKVLYRDATHNTQTALWRLRPGAAIPSHHHSVNEECWVLEGEVQIGDHRLRQGDMHVAHDGYQHPTVTTAAGALLLVRSEIRENPVVG